MLKRTNAYRHAGLDIPVLTELASLQTETALFPAILDMLVLVRTMKVPAFANPLRHAVRDAKKAKSALTAPASKTVQKTAAVKAVKSASMEFAPTAVNAVPNAAGAWYASTISAFMLRAIDAALNAQVMKYASTACVSSRKAETDHAILLAPTTKSAKKAFAETKMTAHAARHVKTTKFVKTAHASTATTVHADPTAKTVISAKKASAYKAAPHPKASSAGAFAAKQIPPSVTALNRSVSPIVQIHRRDAAMNFAVTMPPNSASMANVKNATRTNNAKVQKTARSTHTAKPPSACASVKTTFQKTANEIRKPILSMQNFFGIGQKI